MARGYSDRGCLSPRVVKRYADQEPELRKKYYVGQELVVRTLRCDGSEMLREERRRFKVAGVYRHHLSCVDENGMRESFGYFELEDILVEEGRG